MGRKEEKKKIQDGKELENANYFTTYGKFQHKTFCFLEQPSNKYAITYHIVNLMFILGSIIISVLSTIKSFETDVTFNRFTFVFEIGLLIWFTLEYIFRAWSCSVLKRFRGWRGRLKFLRNFYMCVDAFIIVSTFVTSLLQVERSYFTILRATRFLQVFRILRVDRQKGDLGMMLRIVRTHHRELVTCYFAGVIILFGGSYFVYILENSDPEANITDMVCGLYWGFITVTSVGFGDLSPVTWGGKFVTGIFALVGCAFFALPAGILGSGFAIQVAKQKNQQNLIKIRNPAALLIQTTWRTYATKRENQRVTQLQATWNTLLPSITGNVQWPGYYSCLPGINAICNSKEFSAFNVEVPTSVNRKESIMNPFTEHFEMGMENISPTKKESIIGRKFSRASLGRKFSRPSTSSSRKRSSTSSTTIKRSTSRVNTTLRKDEKKLAKYKAAIEFVLRIKYWCCIYHFKQQRLPFVEITDIRDKNAQWHMETMSFLREMKQKTTNLRQELRLMKVALNRNIYDNATLAIKRRRTESENDVDGHDDVF